MAVPSRAFVGILVFALIASLAVVPYTVLILAGYEPPADAPHELLFPEPSATSAGDKVVLALASLFCLALVVAAWRGLLGVARQDAALRRQRALRTREDRTAPGADGREGGGPPAAPPPRQVEEQPPGYQ
jgi:hypothetical protein